MIRTLFVGTIAMLSSTASANDTIAARGAGGLELGRTNAIDMVSEDLYISSQLVRVNYRFRNGSRSDVETIVAFPMPDRALVDEYGGDVSYPSAFTTAVNDIPVRAELERKAMVNGVDHRAYLESIEIPVAPDTIGDTTRLLDSLPAKTKRELIKLGIAGEEQWDDDGRGLRKHLIPLWVVRDVWWWKQLFPAGKDVLVEHRYAPGVGGSVETPLSSPDFRRSPEGRKEIRKYCVDKSFLAGLDRIKRRGARDLSLPDGRIDYILKTGSNWRSPIGSFRLVVDKGQTGSLVSFCGKGLRKISPTQFELKRRNWRPDDDLHILIVDPQLP